MPPKADKGKGKRGPTGSPGKDEDVPKDTKKQRSDESFPNLPTPRVIISTTLYANGLWSKARQGIRTKWIRPKTVEDSPAYYKLTFKAVLGRFDDAQSGRFAALSTSKRNVMRRDWLKSFETFLSEGLEDLSEYLRSHAGER